MSKYFYVDSENVGDLWIDFLHKSDDDSHFLIFYTKRTPHMSYPNVVQLLDNKKPVEFILCSEGNNALDFQLVSYLGYQLCMKPDDRFFIVSRDTGFDAVIRFWNDRNYPVKRLVNFSNCTDDADSPVKSDLSAIDNSDSNPSDEIIAGIPKSEIDAIIAAAPDKNATSLHLFFTRFYGMQKGLEIYKTVIDKNYVSPEHNPDSRSNFNVLCDCIFRYFAPDMTNNSELIDFMYTHRRNPDKLSGLLVEKFGKAEALRYKKIFKSFYKTLAKI